MIEVGQQAREQRKPLQFPARMLPSEHSHTDLADSSDHTEANRQEAVRAFLSMLVTARASERPVYCWGAGEFGRRLIVSLGDAADKITAIIDSDPSKWGSAWGKQVCSPAVLWDREKFERPYVFIASSASSRLKHSSKKKDSGRGMTMSRCRPCKPYLSRIECLGKSQNDYCCNYLDPEDAYKMIYGPSQELGRGHQVLRERVRELEAARRALSKGNRELAEARARNWVFKFMPKGFSGTNAAGLEVR
jgi:hypothetical protein